MDSKSVNARLSADIRPMLKEAGFTAFTARTYWRHAGNRVEVINFQSFNSYLASGIGCTTYSFSINLGCYFTEVPNPLGRNTIKIKKGLLHPQEYECPFRGAVRKGLRQRELKSDDVWYVAPAGNNLDEVLHDAKTRLEATAFPWFARLAKPGEPLRILLEEDEVMPLLWGFGRRPSPTRNYLIGYFTLAQGDRELARQFLDQAVASGCFDAISKRIAQDLADAGS